MRLETSRLPAWGPPLHRTHTDSWVGSTSRRLDSPPAVAES